MLGQAVCAGVAAYIEGRTAQCPARKWHMFECCVWPGSHTQKVLVAMQWGRLTERKCEVYVPVNSRMHKGSNHHAQCLCLWERRQPPCLSRNVSLSLSCTCQECKAQQAKCPCLRHMHSSRGMSVWLCYNSIEEAGRVQAHRRRPQEGCPCHATEEKGWQSLPAARQAGQGRVLLHNAMLQALRRSQPATAWKGRMKMEHAHAQGSVKAVGRGW